jgi:hypothetical protein
LYVVVITVPKKMVGDLTDPNNYMPIVLVNVLSNLLINHQVCSIGLLHAVTSIIRKDIDNVRFSADHYPASTEVTFAHSLQSMPGSLVERHPTCYLCYKPGD